mmetsp:Transcript_147867/g.474709  ORF Transcript_147867/g.474709 Transcript_147867/m.474709 type:complete len:88 (-) Transcript_147867:48-311(-)
MHEDAVSPTKHIALPMYSGFWGDQDGYVVLITLALDDKAELGASDSNESMPAAAAVTQETSSHAAPSVCKGSLPCKWGLIFWGARPH